MTHFAVAYCLQDEEGGGSGGGCSGQAAYESVRSYCLVRPAVSYTDLISVFYNVTEEQLVKVLEGLTREGVIQVGQCDSPEQGLTGGCIYQFA